MKVFYNSKIAKIATFLGTFDTIMLFGAVFTEAASLDRRTRDHEYCHVEQYLECLFFGLVIAALLIVPMNYFAGAMWSLLWLLLIPILLYYALYLIEWFIALVIRGVKWIATGKEEYHPRDAYTYVSFEQEARRWENEYLKGCDVRKSRGSCGWIKFLGKI